MHYYVISRPCLWISIPNKGIYSNYPFCILLMKHFCWRNREDNVNSLWSREAMWQPRPKSTLAQVMACCLMAPSHYLNNANLPSIRSFENQLRAISNEIPQPLITKITLNITYEYKISFKSPRGKWVNISLMIKMVMYLQSDFNPEITGSFFSKCNFIF